MKDYLPSRQFKIRVIAIAVLVLLGFGIYELVVFIKNRKAQRTPTNLVIKSDVIQKDTNKNGIPDWEESLWGLDPSKNGPSNKEFIIAKRQTLAKENGVKEDNNSVDSPQTENEALSKEFFSVIMSLQESGNLDANTMAAISDTIGKKIVASPVIDLYTKGSIHTEADSEENSTNYFNKIRDLIVKYQDNDIGNELTYIGVGLRDKDPGALNQASSIASAYRSFAKELVSIPVPTSIATLHLNLANDYDKTGQTITDLTKILADPIVGMKALINYKKYSDAIVDDFDKLSDISS